MIRKKNVFNHIQKKSLSLFFLLLFQSLISFAVEKNDKGLLPEVRLNSSDEDKNNETAFKSEVLISKAENNAIESLKKILSKRKGKSDEADLNFRLAELYMRRAKSGRYFDLNEAGSKLEKMGLPNQKSIDALKAAIQIYNKIETQFPKFNNLDAVLFNSALAHSQIQQIPKAQTLYLKLISVFPNSSLIPDALLEVGELYYNQQNFTVALEKFKAIEKFKNSKAYPYALYKSAWAYYNLKQTEAGVDQLVTVIGLNPADSADEKKYNLRKEALRDLTLFVGETTAPEKLYSFFNKICTEKELGEIIIGLASLYESHSRFKEISIFAKEFIDKYPNSPESPKIYIKLINSEETLKNRPQVIASLKKFGEYCQITSEDSKSNCLSEFRKTSLEISKKWWDIWLKNKKHVEFSKLTEKSFEILLDLDDQKNPDSTSRYAYAELLFQLEKFDEAEKNYLQVYSNKSLDKTKQHDALYGALFCLEKLIDKSVSAPEKVEILEFRQQDLAQKYLAEFKNGEHFESLTFKLGFLSYKQKKYDLALEILSPFIKSAQSKNFKAKAEDLILDIYNIKKDFDSIIKLTAQIKKDITESNRLSDISTIHEEAQFSKLQKDAESLKIEERLESLKKFALANKKSKLGKEALWQCISLAYSNGFEVMGAELSIEFVKNHPHDSKNIDALKEASNAYIEAGHLKKAILSLQRLAVIDTKNSSAHIETSCDLLRVNSQLSESRDCYKALFKNSDKNKKLNLLAKLMQTFDSNQSSNELESIENQILQENLEPFATRILITKARSLLKSKNQTEAFNMALKINSRPVDSDVRAEARLIQAEVLENEFISQSVKARESKFAVVLALKTEKFDKAFTAFSSTLKMSKTKNIQADALRGIDRLYSHFIQSLSTMPLPESLAAVEKDALKSELIKLTIPFEEKRKTNLVKLREISSLSSTESALVDWDNYSIEKSVSPRLVFPEAQQISSYIPNSFELKTNPDRFIASEKVAEKKCDPLKLTALSVAGCLQSGKLKDAESLALQLTENSKSRDAGLLYLSMIADQSKQKEKALWMIEKALKISPDNAVINYQKAKLNYSFYDLAQALPYFEKALDQKIQTKEIRILNALKSYSDKDYLTASSELSNLNVDELFKFNTATIYTESVLQKGEFKEASSLAQRLVNAQPKNVDMYLQQARIFEEFTSRKDEAILAYQKALNTSSNSEQKNWLKKKIEYLKLNNGHQITSNIGGAI